MDVVESFVDVGPFRTRYLECGEPDAPPLLLLHDGAWGASAEVSWSALLTSFEGYRAIAPDLLGYGGTAKAVFFDRSSYDFRIDHIGAFLDSLDIGAPVDGIGSSFGGSLLLRMAAAPTHRSRLRSIVSINGSAGVGRLSEPHDRIAHWDGTVESMTGVVDFLTGPFDGLQEHVSTRVDLARQVGHYSAVASRHLPVPAGIERPSDGDWLSRLTGCPIPTLLIRGLQDELLSEEWAIAVKQEMARVMIAEVDARHCPNIDHPQRVLELIDSHLRELGHGV